MIVERLRDQDANVREVSVEDFAREDLLRPEMIRERALGSARFGDNLPHARGDIALFEHDLETGIENPVSQRGFRHGRKICTSILPVYTVPVPPRRARPPDPQHRRAADRAPRARTRDRHSTRCGGCRVPRMAYV